ncbi:MAG: tRNA (N(6)-L-threonylcarbamoyladenosine(37)-C(2))-methylthiotransferase MtaB [Bacteroidales bacterium]|nr:tRNA (N(6)-L-threonylcarbamoyladenosine(37)-C(2))-methylthiotransferase MtaB [Bacteroidales bacterium]
MIDKGTFGTLKALYHTFGCKLNFAETSTVARQFAAEGITRVSAGEKPDIIVVNTCSVTELADKKCRQTIRSYHRRYPDADIIVTGCYAQLKPEESASLEGVAVVAGNDRKADLTTFLHNWLETRSPMRFVKPSASIADFTPSCSRGDRTRYFLKVQDGCDYWCTYCTIPAARGRSRSATVAEIVTQAREAAADGAKEIVITGVNIGDFGKRIAISHPSGKRILTKGTETFLDLIKELDNIEGIERYRISSIEPNLLTDEIIEFCAGSRRFMPHFHIPLQCGSDEVLRLMHRHYDTTLFRHKIERIRQLIPHAFIGVDLIVGARGETDEEFLASKQFVESLPITRLHIFPYSERPGTKALEIAHTVTQEEKHRRVNEMLRISEQKMHGFARQFIGSVRPVLLEHGKSGAPMSGFTDNYLKVSVDAPAELDNTIVGVRLLELIPTDIGDWHLRGELAERPASNSEK